MTEYITGKTKLLCVIGSPVAHSISPQMHNEAIRLLGLDYVYTAFDVPKEKIADALKSLALLGAAGCNVTMPGKIIAAQIADELSDAARLCGAANTVVFRDGRMIADTTDGIGFMRSAERLGVSLKGKKLSVLGAGGAAKAIIVQAALDGVSEIEIFRRKGAAFAETEEFAARVADETNAKILVTDSGDFAALKAGVRESAALVNGTNVGMNPDPDGCLIPDETYFAPGMFVCDIIYDPVETKLMRLAKEADCKVCGGKSILLFQGVASFQEFTGHEAPVDDLITNVFHDEF